ncbi:MAG: hypothetical protein WBD68_05130, partial [Candidatus Sulfotelmatobacter sp.]
MAPSAAKRSTKAKSIEFRLLHESLVLFSRSKEAQRKTKLTIINNTLTWNNPDVLCQWRTNRIQTAVRITSAAALAITNVTFLLRIKVVSFVILPLFYGQAMVVYNLVNPLPRPNPTANGPVTGALTGANRPVATNPNAAAPSDAAAMFALWHVCLFGWVKFCHHDTFCGGGDGCGGCFCGAAGFAERV